MDGAGAARPARQPAEDHARERRRRAGRGGHRDRADALLALGPARARPPPRHRHRAPSARGWSRCRTRAASSSPCSPTRGPGCASPTTAPAPAARPWRWPPPWRNRGRITACDVSAPRLEGAARRLRRAGVDNAERHLLRARRPLGQAPRRRLRPRAGGRALHRHRHMAAQPRRPHPHRPGGPPRTPAPSRPRFWTPPPAWCGRAAGAWSTPPAPCCPRRTRTRSAPSSAATRISPSCHSPRPGPKLACRAVAAAGEGEFLLTSPARHGTDGFFAAILQRGPLDRPAARRGKEARRMICVRRARPGDAAAIGAVHVATWRNAYAGVLPGRIPRRPFRRCATRSATSRRSPTGATATPCSSPSPRAPTRRPARPDGEGRRGGRLRVRRQGAPPRPVRRIAVGSGEVETLYLLDDYRDRGLGRRLMRAMAAHLAAVGCRSVVLWVLRDNPTRWFYQRLGGRAAAREIDPLRRPPGGAGGLSLGPDRHPAHRDRGGAGALTAAPAGRLAAGGRFRAARRHDSPRRPPPPPATTASSSSTSAARSPSSSPGACARAASTARSGPSTPRPTTASADFAPARHHPLRRPGQRHRGREPARPGRGLRAWACRCSASATASRPWRAARRQGGGLRPPRVRPRLRRRHRRLRHHPRTSGRRARASRCG